MPYSVIGNTLDFGSKITGSSPVEVTIGGVDNDVNRTFVIHN